VELTGKVLGVLGTGKIGADVIRIAQGFGMKVVAFDIYKNEALASRYGFPYLSMDEVLEQSDFVTLHVPLTPSTEGMIDRSALGKMRRGSILINTARGALVDEKALKDALDQGHLSAAGLDVLEDEAHPENSPLLASERTVITPHIAFDTQETFAKIVDETIDTIRSFKAGNPTNQVPAKYLEATKMHERPHD
jgi:phosphoglycerate dehydrogenase-like enzyme